MHKLSDEELAPIAQPVYKAHGVATTDELAGKAAGIMRSQIMEVNGGHKIRAISPGSLGDFPIIEQPKLFAQLLSGRTARYALRTYCHHCHLLVH